MLKSGIVRDSSTGEGIPYASIEITDINGTYLGAGVTADVRGSFTIDSLQLQPGSFMRISSVGYGSVSYPYSEYVAKSIFSLDPVAKELPPVKISVPAAGTDSGKVALAAVGLLALILFMRK